LIRQMALAPSLAVHSFHTLRRKAKVPWEQAPKGLQIFKLQDRINHIG
jgi:hypothetical protein